jgi:NAD-dependent dihydropyrimidine dehydrogenase PreA subunit
MPGAGGHFAFVPIAISHKVATVHPSTCIDCLHCVPLDPL